MCKRVDHLERDVLSELGARSGSLNARSVLACGAATAGHRVSVTGSHALHMGASGYVIGFGHTVKVKSTCARAPGWPTLLSRPCSDDVPGACLPSSTNTHTTSFERAFRPWACASLLPRLSSHKHLPAVPLTGGLCNTETGRFAAVSPAGGGATVQSPELVPDTLSCHLQHHVGHGGRCGRQYPTGPRY